MFKDEYKLNGYTILKEIIPEITVDLYRSHFMKLREEGAKPGDKGGNILDPNDPLNRFPRFLDMHEWDELSSKWVSSPIFKKKIEDITGTKIKIFRSMVYFKPPGAKGVAFHQDERYSEVKNLTALWIALDDCTEENGCIEIIPETHTSKDYYEVETIKSDVFFTGEGIQIKELDSRRLPIKLNAGDAVVFDGLTIHGSNKNISENFRRAFIIHYERY